MSYQRQQWRNPDPYREAPRPFKFAPQVGAEPQYAAPEYPLPAQPTVTPLNGSRAGEVVNNTDTTYGTVSAVLGVASLLSGWTFLVPLIGLWAGVRSRRTEPQAQGRALVGLILNGTLLLLSGLFWLLVIAGVVTAAGMGALFLV